MTSDGYSFTFEKQSNNKKRLVKTVVNPLRPNESFSYSQNNRLYKTSQRDHYVYTSYYEKKPHKKKVSKQKAPAGRHGECITTHRFIYHKAPHPHTTVVNAKGGKTHYYYNKYKRLTRLEHHSATGKLTIKLF